MTQKKTGTTSTSTITKGASTLRNIIHFLQGENFQFIIGLLSLIFAVFLLVSFTSFFFTGASDQSIVTDPEPGELLSTDNHIQNSTGARGAVLAEFFINRCFGLAAYFIVLQYKKIMIVPGLVYYSAVIFLNFTIACCYSHLTRTAFTVIILGSLLFLISDSLLALRSIAKKLPPQTPLIILTYVPAQFLLIFGTLL